MKRQTTNLPFEKKMTMKKLVAPQKNTSSNQLPSKSEARYNTNVSTEHNIETDVAFVKENHSVHDKNATNRDGTAKEAVNNSGSARMLN